MSPGRRSFPLMPSDPFPPADDALLLDALHGALTPREAQALEARLASEPALRAAHARLVAESAAWRQGLAPSPEPEAALRVALRIRDRVASEEARVRRDAQVSRTGLRRLVWGRVLAVSVALHVLVLGFLAIHVRQEAQKAEGGWIRATLPMPGLPGEDADWEVVPEPWQAPEGRARLPDDPVLAAFPDVELDEEVLAPLRDEFLDHPRHVVVPMLIRRHEGLKVARLDQYGLDGKDTQRRVELGLDALAHRRLGDGSWPAGGGRGDIGETALALLPFLADGHGSRTGSRGPTVVAPAVAWLRGRLFDEAGAARAEEGSSAVDLGIALRTLSEDYVLSYGHLAPADVRLRATELRALASRVGHLQSEEGAFPGRSDDLAATVWPMWGLEAAVRTGVVPVPQRVPLRFRQWYATTEHDDPDAAAAGLLLARALGDEFHPEAEARAEALVSDASDGPTDPFFLAAAGTGLLLNDPVAFRAWNAGLAERVRKALGPTGVVWLGDPVGDTALHLLALQTAYRTY